MHNIVGVSLSKLIKNFDDVIVTSEQSVQSVTYQVLHAHLFTIHNGFKYFCLLKSQICAHECIYMQSHCIQVQGAEIKV